MKKHSNLVLAFIITVIILTFFIYCVNTQQDSDNDGISDIKEQQLAQMYEPALHFASGEEFFPTNPNYHIQNSKLYMKEDDTNILIESSPTTEIIAQYTTEDYFLNNTLGASEEIAEDYRQYRANNGDRIYARVTSQTQYTIIQYWFFYAYNPGTLNQHQGDWEMIQIILDSTETPLNAAYSQHHSGQIADWKVVEKLDETHPRVYVALGSHANYFRSYQGKLGTESDIVENAYTLKPEDLDLVILGEKGPTNHPANQNWLEFGGRWGNWDKRADTYLGSAGPSGPGQNENQEKWEYPISWASERFVVNQTWFTASFIVYHFLYIYAAVLAIRITYKLWRIFKRKKQRKLNIKRLISSKAAFGIILGIVGIIVFLFALFLPWYLVTGNVKTPLLETVGTTELVLIDGVNGVRVNTLQNEQGLATLFGLGIPFSVIFLSSVILNALDIIGVEKAKDLSKTYIISGITSLIPLIILIVFIVLLTGLVTSFAGSLLGGQPISPQVTDMVSAISESPFGGNYSDTINSSGSVTIDWGLATGSYLFVVAAAIKIIAGVVLRTTKTPIKDQITDR